MGTSRSAAELGRKLDAFAKELGNNRGALDKTGLAGKGIFTSHAVKAGVYGKKVAGKRKAINARYDLTKDQRGVVVTYTGPAHLVNNPTKQHFIGARRLGTRAGMRRRSARIGAMAAFGGSNRGGFGALRNVRGAQALTIGADLRPYAFHPGTPGKGFYQDARAQCAKVLPGVYGRAAITTPLRKVFG